MVSNYKKADEEEKKPYASAYQPQLQEALDRIMNREDFSYDLSGDALYDHYRDSYTRMGRQAMEDTVGQAAAMTGGYGNSYAQTAGQQVYGSYMQQLGDKIPELYALAMEQYNAQGDAMYEQFAMLQGLEETDYSRYLDDAEHQRWLAEFEESKRQYEQSQQMKQAQLDDEKALAAAQLMAKKGDYTLLAAYYGLTPEQLQLLQGMGYGSGDEEEKKDRKKKDLPPLAASVEKGSGITSNKQLRPVAYGTQAVK